jgi:hypothetical protein
MKTLTIALAGSLLAAAALLAGCNDEAAPVANGSGQPDQVATDAAQPVVATPAPEIAPPPAPPASQASPPSARLVNVTPLAPRTATRAVGAGVRGRADTFYGAPRTIAIFSSDRSPARRGADFGS